jgi:hypothetical protein
MLEISNPYISVQKEQLGTVRETVRTAMKSTWTDIVMKNPSTMFKKAVKSVDSEKEQSRNFILNGAKDNDGEHDNNEELTEIMTELFLLK